MTSRTGGIGPHAPNTTPVLAPEPPDGPRQQEPAPQLGAPTQPADSIDRRPPPPTSGVTSRGTGVTAELATPKARGVALRGPAAQAGNGAEPSALGSSSLAQSQLARVLAHDPEAATPLSRALRRAAADLETLRLYASPEELPARELEQMLAALAAGERLWAAGDFEAAARQLSALPARMDAVLASLPASPNRDGLTRRLQASQGALVSQLERAARVDHVVPPGLVAQAEELFAAYLKQADMLLSSCEQSGYANWVDTFGLTGRERPGDVANALVQYKGAALYNVLADLRTGQIGPDAFGKKDWSAVTPFDIWDLAARRVERGEIDFSAAHGAMLRDPIWQQSPVGVRGDDDSRSIHSLVAPKDYASRLQSFPVFATMRLHSGLVAQAPDDERGVAEARALIALADHLHAGSELPADASQALPAIVEATGTSPVARLDATTIPCAQEPELTEQALEARLAEQKDAGLIDGFVKRTVTLPDPERPRDRTRDRVETRYVAFKLKSAAEIGREVTRAMEQGELSHLGEPTLRAMKSMLGPDGTALAERLDEEAAGKAARAFGEEVVNLVAVSVITAGVGSVVGGAGVALNASARALKVAGFVSNSLTFSTLMNAAEGRFDLGRYPLDAAMFGVLHAMQPVQQLVAGLVRSQHAAARLLEQGVAFGLTTAAPAATLTAAQAVQDRLLGSGHWPDAESLGQQFLHAWAVVGILHSVNTSLGKIAPALAPNAAVKTELEGLLRRAELAMRENQARFERLSSALRIDPKSGNIGPAASVDAADVQRLLAELSAGRAEAARLGEQVLQFAERYAGLLPGGIAADLEAQLGRAFRDGAVEMRAAGDPQVAKVQTALVAQFSLLSGRLGIEPGMLAEGVTGVSAAAQMAFMDAARSPLASVGADNVHHLASVFGRVVREAAARGPVTQRQLDELFVETVMTDFWFKGVAELAEAPVAPTNAGRTGGEVLAHLQRQAEAVLLAGGPVSPEVSRLSPATESMVRQWVAAGRLPMSEAAVREAVRQRVEVDRLDEAAAARLETEALAVWQHRIMPSGQALSVMPALLGTWVHGIPAFSLVENVVRSIPGGPSPQTVYEAVLGHHMAGFVAAGFGRGNLRVDFAAIERVGQLPPGAARRLQRLYDSAAQLATKWRPRIDKGLSPAEREAYHREASFLRQAIDGLSPAVRRQLLADDAAQFTEHLAMGKWFGMQPAPSNRGAIEGVIKAAQCYLEEARARDSAPRAEERAKSFIAASGPALERVGVTYDAATGSFRIAQPGEAAYTKLASHVLQSPELSRRLAQDLGIAGQSTIKPRDVVEWFHAQAKAAETLTAFTLNDAAVARRLER